jgi:hypothetical protein
MKLEDAMRGTFLRELEWKTSIFSERAAPKTPSAP